MKVENLEQLQKRSKELGDIQIVTDHGSIDCQGEPAQQESIVSALLESEVWTALSILAEGGNFVIKMFTMFESETVCLLYLLSIAFKQIEVFKPATSKEGNSEVYVVCKDYHRTEWLSGALQEAKAMYGRYPEDKSMFDKADIPSEFLDA